MAYQYGAIQPNVSSSATEKERTEARRAFGLSKASYLSSMDQYYAGIEAQKETREDTQAHELEMFEKESPFKWEQLRLQEKGIETQRYGIDVGAETSRYGADVGAKSQRYGVDTRAGTAKGQLGYQYDWMGAQQEQFGFGNRLAYERDRQSGAIDQGLSYEDLGGYGGGGQEDGGFWSGQSWIPDGYSDSGSSGGDYQDYGLTESGGDDWYSGMEDYDIEEGWG